MSVQSERRTSQQKKAFIGWVNAHLQQRSMHIDNLENISQVSPLIHLLEILEKKPLNKITKNHKKPRNKFDKMEGMRTCLNYIRSKESSNVNPFDVETLVSGKEVKIYLALIWRIITSYGIATMNDDEDIIDENKINKNENKDNDMNDIKKQEPPKQKKTKIVKSAEQCLRHWVNSRLSKELQITNFTTEWSNGKVLIHLMNQALAKNNQMKPESINMDNTQLLHDILEINDKHLHIPQLLDPKDLVTAPNKEAVMTYVLLLKSAIQSCDAHKQNEPEVKHNENEAVENNAPDIDPDFDAEADGADTELQVVPEKDMESKPKIVCEKLEIVNDADTAGVDGMELLESDEELSDDEDYSKNNVDLCILCDVTDSMKDWIGAIKNGIRRIVNELKNTFGIGTLRLSFVGYRDWNDDNNNKGELRIEKLKFIKHIVYFESFVENVKPAGGGDAAEDVLGGIQETLQLKWKAPIRVLYHICDAPAHGTMYHDYFEMLEKQKKYAHDEMSFLDGSSGDDSDSEEKNEDEDGELLAMDGDDDVCDALAKEREAQLLRDEFDKWPDKYPQDPKHQDLFLELKKKNIRYYMGTQTKFTDKMVGVFKEYCDSIGYTLTTMNLYNVSQFLPTLIAAVEHAVRIVVPPNEEEVPPPVINLEKLQKKKVNFQVHCGIDFGTAGSGFAYSLPGTNKVYTDQDWNNSGKHVDVKTKTNILLDINGNCIAFGDDATDKYTHTDTNDLFFERFKMALYEKEMVIDDDEKQQESNYFQSDIRQYLTAANGKELPARKVLEEALRFMKDHAMHNLRKRVNKDLKIENVQWILTVPAIWSDTAKSVMKTAAINAGMINESIEGQLIIAYEPDCASLSILHEINEKARDMHQQQKRIKREKLAVAQNVEAKENEAIVSEDDDDDYKSFFERGDKILLCDLGGGTADIACHELDENERIRQIVAPGGGAWGSTYVDQHFLNLLDDIFSKQWMNEFKKEEPSKYVAFLQNFRNAKKTYKMNEKKKVKKKEYDTTFHNIKVPFNFIAFMEEKLADLDDDDPVLAEQDDDDDMLENIVKNFTKFGKKGLMALNEEYLELSYTIWNYLFDQVVDCIVCHCKKLLLLPEMDSCKYLCLVGGFSESKHLQAKMFSNFGRKSRYNLHIFTPMRPVLSVVDGAARMGLKPDFISARTIAKTYGIAIQKDLFEFKSIYPHSVVPKIKVSKRLVYSKHNKKQMISKQVINDVFLPFVRKNTLIRNNDKPVIYWVEAADIKANKISIRLYDSYESDPMFVDDKRQANKIEVELSDSYKLNKEPIPIIFIFNDTTIRVFVDMIQADGKHKTKEISLNFDVLR